MKTVIYTNIVYLLSLLNISTTVPTYGYVDVKFKSLKIVTIVSQSIFFIINMVF